MVQIGHDGFFSLETNGAHTAVGKNFEDDFGIVSGVEGFVNGKFGRGNLG
jgi:hypothetical protein